MNTIDYLDAAKARLGITSDYALAKHLQIRPSTISGYRAGKSQMDDEISRAIAAVLDMHPGLVMLDMHRERATTPEQEGIWNEIYKGFLSLLPLAKWTVA